MNLKTIPLLTMILLSVSLCGCIDTETTIVDSGEVIAYYQSTGSFDSTTILYVNNHGEINSYSVTYNDEVLYSDDNWIIIYSGGLNSAEHAEIRINSSVIDSKQV